MYEYKHNEEERQYIQEKIDKLHRENELGSIFESQVEANKHVIKQLEMIMDQKVYVGGDYVRLDVIREGLKDKNFRCTPRSMLAAE